MNLVKLKVMFLRCDTVMDNCYMVGKSGRRVKG